MQVASKKMSKECVRNFPTPTSLTKGHSALFWQHDKPLDISTVAMRHQYMCCDYSRLVSDRGAIDSAQNQIARINGNMRSVGSQQLWLVV